MSSLCRRVACAVPVVLLLAVVSPGSLCQAAATEAITSPSEDVTLSFVRPGRVARVLVKEGDAVAAGQVLVELDDEAERLQLEQLKLQAEDTVRVRAAEAQWAQKKVDAAKWEEVFSKGGATGFERDRARLEATIAELSLELAKFECQQNVRKYQEAKVQVDRMRLRSPLAGQVEELFVSAGESVDALAKVVRVVKTDPLWVDVPVPLDEGRRLKVGGVVQVAFPAPVKGGEEGAGTRLPPKPAGPDEVQPAPVPGRIIHVAAVADAASNTLRVRIEVPNPAGRPAGEHVMVSSAQATTSGRDREAASRSATSRPPQSTEGAAHGTQGQ